MRTILIIGASGFVGRHLARALLGEGSTIRCLARDPARVQDLAAAGCEVVHGDISDFAAVQRAVQAVHAVYICIYTLSRQPGSGTNVRFMEVEKDGMQNVVTACRSCSVNRVVYVTSLGIGQEEPSEWLRERWHTEQLLLNSGLEATVIRPGCIVGVGGHGIDAIMGNARRQIAVSLGGNRPQDAHDRRGRPCLLSHRRAGRPARLWQNLRSRQQRRAVDEPDDRHLGGHPGPAASDQAPDPACAAGYARPAP